MYTMNTDEQCKSCAQLYISDRSVCMNCSRRYEDAYKLMESLFEVGPQFAAKAKEWPDNLYRDVFGIDACDYTMRPLFFSEKAVEKATEDFSEREKDILRHRYVKKLTMADIGKILGVSRERVHQILAKSQRKLRHPSRSKYLIYGENYQPLSTQFPKEEAAETVQETDEEIGEIEENKVEGGEITLGTTINEIILSVRAYNCLRRAGCNTVGDICSLTEERLRKIRNLGARTAEEIKTLLSVLGFSLADEQADK